MISFPSSLNRGGLNFKNNNDSDITSKVNDDYVTSTGLSEDLYRMKALNLNLNATTHKTLLADKYIDISRNNDYMAQTQFNNGSTVLSIENPFHLSSAAVDSANRYKFIYNKATKNLFDLQQEVKQQSLAEKKAAIISAGGRDAAAEKEWKKTHDSANNDFDVAITHTASTQSMFNPTHNINVVGMVENTPLLNNVRKRDDDQDYKFGDCSIKNLVAHSHRTQSNLGAGRFKYADFMYCKDLGKVSNNHLIVLRKFTAPIGDNIFGMAGPRYRNNSKSGTNDFDTAADTGRLVTWFGTEDNKLEDILHYNYQASWKQLNSKIQELDSKEDNPQRGLIGMIANSISPSYNSMANAGFAGTHNIYSKIGGAMGISQQGSDNTECLRNYDNNRVYTPKNTIQDTHIYEGKLTFSQEFSLTFSYKLRAYDNINPKSAFIDLLGNILEVTYRKGTFWGGARKIIGPQPNTAAWKKMNAFIDNTWDKLGGIIKGLGNGTLDLGTLLSDVASKISDAISEAGTAIVNAIQGKSPKELMQSAIQGMVKLNQKTGFTDAIKGQLKNVLGRPSMYAFDSLLSGDNVGLWHITVGNPFNPIFACGNLIMTDASIQHSGPLGVDDFPTELKVTVKLKHARSRDLTEISRMYTKGVNGIYNHTASHKLSDFFDAGSKFDEKKYDELMDKLAEGQKYFDSEVEEQVKAIDEYNSNLDKLVDAETKNKILQWVKNNKKSVYDAKTGGIKMTAAYKSFLKEVYGADFDGSNPLSDITGSTYRAFQQAINSALSSTQDTIDNTQIKLNDLEIAYSDVINRGYAQKHDVYDLSDPANSYAGYAKEVLDIQAKEIEELTAAMDAESANPPTDLITTDGEATIATIGEQRMTIARVEVDHKGTRGNS